MERWRCTVETDSSLSARSSKNLFLILQKYSSFYLPKVVAITGRKSEHRMTPKTLENSHFWQKGSTFMARPSLAEKDILNPSEAIEYFVLSRRKFYDLLNADKHSPASSVRSTKRRVRGDAYLRS